MQKRITSLARVVAASASLALAACQADLAAPHASSSQPLVAPAGAAHAAAPLAAARSAQAIPGQYIVVFRPGSGRPAGAAGLMVAAENGGLRHVYSLALDGFAASLSESAARRIARHPHVLAVVPDVRVARAAGGTQVAAPWGLDRLDQRALPLGGAFAYATDGAGVTVYIVDTGINAGHVEYTGRVAPGFDAITAGGSANDCHGHGTHVAGTVGGTKYGVAKGARLVGVRVLDCSGNGTSSSVIAGLDWILKQKAANPSLRAVANMSLAGGVSPELDNAVAALVAGGVTTVVAAGNSAVDACTSSPARAPAAVTVGATDASDRFASFSNHGACVDLEAPGVGVTSAYVGSATAAATMSGTSMAAPHAAGAAALYVGANPAATPAQVASALTANATVNAVVGAPVNTANRLLYVGFLGAAPPNAAPTATISAPNAAAVFAQGASVTFAGAGSDPETGALSGASLVWTSSLQGRIGTGASFATTALVAGTHGITLTARDPQGATGTATRTLTVSAPAPAGPVGLLSSQTGKGCLTTSATATNPQGSLTLAVCAAGGAAQTWTVPAVGAAAGPIKAQGACLTAHGTASNATLGTSACVTGSAAQQWTRTSLGEVKSAAGLCVNQAFGGVLLRTCNGTYLEQRWTLR
jgi:subtilisin family serine protease